MLLLLRCWILLLLLLFHIISRGSRHGGGKVGSALPRLLLRGGGHGVLDQGHPRAGQMQRRGLLRCIMGRGEGIIGADIIAVAGSVGVGSSSRHGDVGGAGRNGLPDRLAGLLHHHLEQMGCVDGQLDSCQTRFFFFSLFLLLLLLVFLLLLFSLFPW